jgi:hypothetical protein
VKWITEWKTTVEPALAEAKEWVATEAAPACMNGANHLHRDGEGAHKQKEAEQAIQAATDGAQKGLFFHYAHRGKPQTWMPA